MDWKDIENAVAKVSPFLGTALGGPVGGAVGALVASKLGVKESPEAILGALDDPKLAIQLKNIELQQSQTILKMLTDSNSAQAAIDLVAQGSDKWYSHWRDAAGWVAVVGLFYGTVGVHLLTMVIHIFAPQFVVPDTDTGTLISLLISMLGLSGIHAAENVKMNS